MASPSSFEPERTIKNIHTIQVIELAVFDQKMPNWLDMIQAGYIVEHLQVAVRWRYTDQRRYTDTVYGVVMREHEMNVSYFRSMTNWIGRRLPWVQDLSFSVACWCLKDMTFKNFKFELEDVQVALKPTVWVLS